MDPITRQQRQEFFARRCKELGLPITSQRRAVLDAVLDRNDHPTADDVHTLVRRRLPEVSRTTVYRTLDTLVRLGIITKACHPGSVVRFDPRTELHHHLVCMHCDRVLDFEDARLDAVPIPDTSGTGFEVSDFRVQLRGICQHCRQKEERE